MFENKFLKDTISKKCYCIIINQSKFNLINLVLKLIRNNIYFF